MLFDFEFVVGSLDRHADDVLLPTFEDGGVFVGDEGIGLLDGW